MTCIKITKGYPARNYEFGRPSSNTPSTPPRHQVEPKRVFQGPLLNSMAQDKNPVCYPAHIPPKHRTAKSAMTLICLCLPSPYSFSSSNRTSPKSCLLFDFFILLPGTEFAVEKKHKCQSLQAPFNTRKLARANQWEIVNLQI